MLRRELARTGKNTGGKTAGATGERRGERTWSILEVFVREPGAAAGERHLDRLAKRARHAGAGGEGGELFPLQ